MTLGIYERVLGNLTGDKVKLKQVKVPKASFQMEVNYTQASSSDQERFDFVLGIYASWLARANLRRIGLEANTSYSVAHTEQLALTSEPINCTVRTLSSCKNGGSNK